MHLRVLDLRVTMCHRLVKDIREVTGKLLCVTCTRLYHNHKFKALSFICNKVLYTRLVNHTKTYNWVREKLAILIRLIYLAYL